MYLPQYSNEDRRVLTNNNNNNKNRSVSFMQGYGSGEVAMGNVISMRSPKKRGVASVLSFCVQISFDSPRLLPSTSHHQHQHT